jgi:hypothetical protein
MKKRTLHLLWGLLIFTLASATGCFGERTFSIEDNHAPVLVNVGEIFVIEPGPVQEAEFPNWLFRAEQIDSEMLEVLEVESSHQPDRRQARVRLRGLKAGRTQVRYELTVNRDDIQHEAWNITIEE